MTIAYTDVTINSPTGVNTPVGPTQITVTQITTGLTGPSGTGGVGGAGYTHNQDSPVSLWSISHNLGFRPSVSAFSMGGVTLLGTVTHLSANVLQISFSSPVAGTARLN
jgi:hypothetical protein